MNRIAVALSRLVRGSPVGVIAVAVMLTTVFAALSTNVETTSGDEGFAPDNAHLDAAETIGEQFNGSDEQIVQILVGGDDVISADGLATVRAVEEAVERSDVGDLLSAQGDRPAVVSWLSPVEQALAEQGIDPATADDAAIKAAFLEAMAAMPVEQAGMITALLPDDADAEASQQARSGLVLIFHETAATSGASDDEAFDQLSAVHTDLAAQVGAADLPAGFSAEPFSFPLLFSDDDSFDAELGTLFGSAFAIILVILAFVYWLRPGLGLTVVGAGRRTVADLLLTMATIVMAIVWMNGIGALLGPGYLGWIGGLNDVSQVIPVLLIGLGVDYAIHITTRYREEAAAGASVSDGIGRAVTTVGVALVLATVTTAVGFLTNIINPVPALQDFGVLAAVGIVASFLLMLTFVPAVRLLLDGRAERLGHLPRQALGRTSERVLPGIMSRAAVLAERTPVATVLVTVVLGGALGAWGMSRLETKFSVTDFVSDDAPAVATFDEIVDRFGGGFGESTDVLISGDVATPAVHNALVAAHDDLAGVPDVATFGEQAQAESPVTLLGALLAPGAPPAPQVADAAEAAGVGDDLTVAGDADVAALYDALLAAAPEQAAGVLARNAQGEYKHARVAIQTSAGEAGAGTLLDNLDAVFTQVRDARVSAAPTSNEIINEVIVTALRDSQVSSMIITLVAAMLLLTITFWVSDRRPLLGVITIAPVVLVVLWTFAMMAATGIPFGPITATIAALAIGIGVPYTIHITNRYKEDRVLHADPNDAIRSTVRHTGGALAGSAFTTCAGFGILVTSSLTPFRQFGLVTVYAIGFALLAATLVLPSMLALWDRWHRRRALPVPVAETEREPVQV